MIACHGQEGGELETSDRKLVNLRDLQELLSADECPALKGVPKLVLVSACRGENEPRAYGIAKDVAKSKDSVDAVKAIAEEPSELTNCDTDFFLEFSTVEGNVSARDSDKGILYFPIVLACTIMHNQDLTVIWVK